MKFSYATEMVEGVNLVLPFYKSNLNFESFAHLTGSSSFDFNGEKGEVHTVYTSGQQKIYLLGLGDEDHPGTITESFHQLVHLSQKYWGQQIQIDLRPFDATEILNAIIGLEMAAYSVRKDKKSDTNLNREVILLHPENDESLIRTGSATGQTINEIKYLVDAPPNIKTPQFLADFARDSAKRNDYHCTIWEKDQLKEKGLSAILAVGQGSVHEPKLIELRYQPRVNEGIHIGLVGKGITFDSGGLSIKGAQNMHYMKSDMGGAAAVLGAVELAAKLKLDINITAVVPCAENAVDGRSYRPGDVISSYSGHTIEIIDTDAEGRLILADGLNYLVTQHQPEHLVDVATLTGSVVRTLGYAAAGVWTKNQRMADRIAAAGIKAGERVWLLPLYDEYRKEIESDVADIRNLGSKPIAGASIAASFLEFFTKEHQQWMHLDIAGVAFGDTPFTKMKAATGFGVRLLIQYIQSLIQERADGID